MSRHLKYILSTQKCLQTFATLRRVLHSGHTRTREGKCVLNVFPGITTTSLHKQKHSFSSDIPKRSALAVLQAEDEDNDDNNDTVQGDDFLVSVVMKGRRLSSPEWEAVKDKVCAENRMVSYHNIDAILIGLCGRLLQPDVGLSYLEHLTASGRKLNIATMAQCMRMYYLCRGKGIDEQLVLSMYKDLRARCPVMDAYTAENAIMGLCLTSNWKLGLDLLDMTKLTCVPASTVYNVLIKTAYDNNEPNVSLRLISENLHKGRGIRPEVFHAQLDYLHRTSPTHELRWQMLEECLKMFVENGLKPTKDVAERIRVWYQDSADHKAKVHAEFSTVTDGGICKSCQKHLNTITITEEEFRTLQCAFMDRVVVGKDIFRNTTPEEMKEFLHFVKMTSPYDMVIDGLNVAFAGGSKKTVSPQLQARTLHHVVKHFVRKSKKVLVLGRKHMQTWTPSYMDYIYRNAHVFLAQNMTQDDPLLLYAALYSGMGTKFLSKDLMRGHAYLLKNQNLRLTFRRWQLLHQCQLRYVTESGKVHLKLPLTFNPMAQVSSNGSWHIPYEMEFDPTPPQSFEPPSTWLCLRRD